uniref:Uncharacterized protein n=1 Tax=Anguilla anguilla TaxID=7936 RepID=A0A0E9XEW3_ANGAN
MKSTGCDWRRGTIKFALLIGLLVVFKGVWFCGHAHSRWLRVRRVLQVAGRQGLAVLGDRWDRVSSVRVQNFDLWRRFYSLGF